MSEEVREEFDVNTAREEFENAYSKSRITDFGSMCNKDDPYSKSILRETVTSIVKDFVGRTYGSIVGVRCNASGMATLNRMTPQFSLDGYAIALGELGKYLSSTEREKIVESINHTVVEEVKEIDYINDHSEVVSFYNGFTSIRIFTDIPVDLEAFDKYLRVAEIYGRTMKWIRDVFTEQAEASKKIAMEEQNKEHAELESIVASNKPE